MTKTVKTTKVDTLKDFTSLVENALPGANHLLWFRGVGLTNHDLTPGFYRNPPAAKPAELLDIERRMLTRFRQRSIPFQTRPLGDFWDCLFVMQHFGIPTRLLDWTENPYIALYFALISSPKRRQKNRWIHEADAAVWLLDPALWNAGVLEGIHVASGVLSTDDEVVSGYSSDEKSITRDEPIAIYGSHNSTRIVAQRGVFTVAGASLNPLNKIYEANDKIKDLALAKLEIPKETIPEFLRSLLSIGFTESVVFPDMEGLAREIKRSFGF